MKTHSNSICNTFSHNTQPKRSILVLIRCILFIGVLFCVKISGAVAQTPTAETGIVSGVSSFWQPVALSNTYTSMVVVATLVLPASDRTPMVARVRNASGNSFELSLQGPDGGDDLFGFDVHYFVVEEGVYTAALNGIKMEAVRANSVLTAGASDFDVFEPRTFQNSYTSPVVIGQVMTENDSSWSVFWASSASDRRDPPNSSSFAAGKHVSEDPDTTRANETIGYVVFESGNAILNGMTVYAALSTDDIEGTGNTSTGFPASVSGLGSVDRAVVSSAAMDGGNGGWAVLYGPTPVSASQILAAIDEDTLGDAERNHTTEQIGYVAFDTSASQPPIANISLTPSSGLAPLLVNFDGSGSTDNMAVTSWQWDFGDGNNASGQLVNHTYTAVGNYTVTLTVTDADGLQGQITAIVNVIAPGAQVVSEIGVVNGVTDTWQVINLASTYTSMVVVASVVLPDQSSIPAVTRVRNALGNSFELRVQNPSGSAISGYDVHYFVIEEGVYTSATNGVDMEAVRVNSTQTSNRSGWIFEPRSYQNSYIDPVVLGQVMTANDLDWSVFWASATAVRNQAPTAAGYAAGKNVAEDPDNVRANETLGIIVIESGSGLIASTEFVAATSPDIIRATGDSSVGYSLNYGTLSNPVAALVSTTGIDGGNGGWPILFGATPLTNSILTVSFDEDQVRDNERNHTTEQVGYIIFGTP